MKAFAIFPTFCVFLQALTLFSLDKEMKFRTAFVIAIFFMIVFGGAMVIYSNEIFILLYFANIIGISIAVPCLTYLLSRMLPATDNRRKYWIRILLLGLISTVVTLLCFGVSMVLGFMCNPMDYPH